MALYKVLKELWKRPKQNLGSLYKERLIQFRRDPAIVKIDKPTNLARARSLGYKAKKGIVVVRVRVKAGGRMRPKFKAGRRSKHLRRTKIVSKSYQVVAEERAQRKFTNLEVLNSYEVMHDSVHKWFEVIMVDPYRPEIKKDKNLSWIVARKHTNRVLRGKTSAGKKSRGLRGKGKGHEKARPSLRAKGRQAN
ncbi:50S ribosomal protein L15e [Candidatus Woesearchaeota archaeon]|nr:MAG: 50S ribosomal protein L15e [Candidatus Woesearchaeota archaeon]